MFKTIAKWGAIILVVLIIVQCTPGTFGTPAQVTPTPTPEATPNAKATSLAKATRLAEASFATSEAKAALPSTPTPTLLPTPQSTYVSPKRIEVIKNSASAVTYDDLARNTENWVGKTVHLRGEVLQVFEGEDGYYGLIVRVIDGDRIAVYYDGPRLLAGDEIDLYAFVNGRITLDNAWDIPETMPELTARLVERLP